MATATAPADTFRIRITEQRIVTFKQAAALLPSRREGKPTSQMTIQKWANKGSKARDGQVVKLPCVRVGWGRCTSVEALDWYFERLSAEPDTDA